MSSGYLAMSSGYRAPMVTRPASPLLRQLRTSSHKSPLPSRIVGGLGRTAERCPSHARMPYGLRRGGCPDLAQTWSTSIHRRIAPATVLTQTSKCIRGDATPCGSDKLFLENGRGLPGSLSR